MEAEHAVAMGQEEESLGDELGGGFEELGCRLFDVALEHALDEEHVLHVFELDEEAAAEGVGF